MYEYTRNGYTPSDEIQIIHFWTGVENVNNAAWICPLLFLLTVIQYFGVRGYGEVSHANIGTPFSHIVRSNSP